MSASRRCRAKLASRLRILSTRSVHRSCRRLQSSIEAAYIQPPQSHTPCTPKWLVDHSPAHEWSDVVRHADATLFAHTTQTHLFYTSTYTCAPQPNLRLCAGAFYKAGWTQLGKCTTTRAPATAPATAPVTGRGMFTALVALYPEGRWRAWPSHWDS